MRLTNRWATTMTLQIPLISFLMIALGASTLLALKHEATIAHPNYAIAGDASRPTPYGSGAAVRNLLF